MKVNKLQNSNLGNFMTSSLDDVIKIAKMAKILYILDNVIAFKYFFQLKFLFFTKYKKVIITHIP